MRHRKRQTEENNPSKGNLIIVKTDLQDQYYKTINLTSLLDKNLSFKAKGLHSYIMTRPDNWQLWSKALFSTSTDGETSVRSAINELIENNYLYRTTIRDKKKKIKAWIYISFSIPTKVNKQLLEKLNLGNLKIDNQDLENQAYSNKNNSNKNNSNKTSSLSKDKDYVFSKHEEQIISIINFWNNLPNSVTHSNPETKTYKTIFLQIENLFCGLPLIRKKDNSPTKPFLEFLSSNHIPSSLHTKYWRKNGIKNILQIIHDDIPEGEKISLNQTLWNAFAKRRGGGFSLFLHTATQIDIPQKYIQLATKLATSINDTRMITSNKKQWAQEFQQFIEKDNIPINEINGLIEWYGKNRGGKYIPVVDSPKELQEKYSRLKLAMARSNPQPQQSDVKLSPTGFPLIDHAYPKINVLSKDRRSQIPKTTLEDWQELLEGYTKRLLNADIWTPNHRPRKIAVFNGVVSMQEWLEKVDYSVDGGANLREKIRPLNELITYYILCIDDWWGGWMDGVKDNVFDVNNKIFKMFIREMETSFSVRMHIKSEGWINDSDWEPRD